MKYGYARISTGKQNTDRQVEELKNMIFIRFILIK